KYIERAEVERVADPALAFFNVNTPEDLRRARELAGELGLGESDGRGGCGGSG
ncbi:MAG: hypothetical protein H5T97_03780, partial [Firmicutes bacterium]|nr:hypothetical protein [Bacillota bacterium]